MNLLHRIPILPEPEGPDILFFSDNFDSERYGTTGGVVIPRLGFRPGMAGVKPKPPYPARAVHAKPYEDRCNRLRLSACQYDGYGNIKLSYYTRASSYVSGSIVAEWSGDGGATWSTLEEFKLAPGTPEAPRAESNTLKT